jgi:glutathione S-transferase
MLRALPPSYRQRALSEIEALIARAERDLARHDAARTGKAKAQDRLQRERRRLALLYRSRQFLCSDEFSAVKARRPR